MTWIVDAVGCLTRGAWVISDAPRTAGASPSAGNHRIYPVPHVLHLIDERHDLGHVLGGLGPLWRVIPGRPVEGAPPAGVVVVAPAAGTAPAAARTRAAATARRYGWPVILICDGMPMPARDLDPGVDLVSLSGLSAAALIRVLRHARARNEAAPMQAPAAVTVTGLTVHAALSAASALLQASTPTAAELRRHAVGDPRAARHAEAIAWGLRETGAAIGAALAADVDPDNPLPAHTLISVAEPLLKSALGSGVKLACTDDGAPLRLVAGAAVDLVVHAAADLLPLIAAESGRPALRLTVSGDPDDLVLELAAVDAAPPTHERTSSAATRAAAARCGATASVTAEGFLLRLPFLPLAAAQEQEQGPSILLIDDNPDVAAAIAATLTDATLAIATVSTAEQALEQIALQPGIRVVVSDLALPGMDGLALAQRLRAVGCRARVLLITGLADERTDAAVANGLVTAVIYKPFQPAALVTSVRAALAAAAALKP